MMNKRNRTVYAFGVILVMIAGLLSRKYVELLPQWLNTYLGDSLWALMIFLGLAMLFTKKKTKTIILFTLLFCYGIECSQLYHAPWIEALRQNTIGHLILGYGFLWSDLVAYTIGAGVGALVDRCILTILK